jgi:hypothetical protein
MEKVNAAIIKAVLPECYRLINELISATDASHKQLIISAKRILPKSYSNSFSKGK